MGSVYFWLSMKSLQRPLLHLGMEGKELWNAAGKTGAHGDASATGMQESPVLLPGQGRLMSVIPISPCHQHLPLMRENGLSYAVVSNRSCVVTRFSFPLLLVLMTSSV